MRAVSRLVITLDAGGGWGDPVQVHRTIALTEAACFADTAMKAAQTTSGLERLLEIDPRTMKDH